MAMDDFLYEPNYGQGTTTTMVCSGNATTMAQDDADGELVDCSSLLRPASRGPAVDAMAEAITHTFEFRLSASEQQVQSIGLRANPQGYRAIAGIRHVRAFITREGESAAGSRGIGGVEVWTETRPQARPATLECFARLSDFDAAEFVVVQVDVVIEYARE
jgi:hypothetical protein